MQIFRHYDDLPEECRGSVTVLGNFDGVHRGHQAVIGKALSIAHEYGQKLTVLTFEPHPRSYFRPDDPPFRLTTFRNKAHHLAALGIDQLVVLTFDETLAGMGAEDFIADVLVKGIGASHVVVGYDFCFGRGRTGTPELIRDAGGIDVTVVEPVTNASEEVYSSTRIRDYLMSGQPGHAAAILGRPFEIEARVTEGARLGRTLGFPTANLDLGEYLRPAYGVYAVRVGLEEDGVVRTWYDGVANLGRRPTVDGLKELFEVHFFDFSGDLYGKHLRVALIEFLRREQKFDGLDALKAQIARDCEVARRILGTRAAGAN